MELWGGGGGKRRATMRDAWDVTTDKAPCVAALITKDTQADVVQDLMTYANITLGALSLTPVLGGRVCSGLFLMRCRLQLIFSI